MALTNPQHPLELSVSTASTVARNMVELEARGADTDAALRRIEVRYGISPAALEHLRHRRAKTCDVSLFERLRSAYLDICARQVRRLQHEIRITTALGGSDDYCDLAAEIEAVAAKVAAAQERVNGGALLTK